MGVGRPTVMTPETVSKLEHAFSLGCTDIEACFYAGISRTSLHKYQTEYPEFADRKEELKQTPVLKARVAIMEQLDAKDKQTAQWYLERKKKDEFSTKTETEINMEVKDISSEPPEENSEEWLKRTKNLAGVHKGDHSTR